MTENTDGPVVVGVDGSDSARVALEWGAKQATLMGVPLVAVTTWSWAANYGYAVAFASEYDPESDARQVLSDMVASLPQSYPELSIATHAVQGEPREVLVDRSRGASMLVVGRRGHGEIAGLLLGSVSGYCVAHAHCPTLVVR